MPLLEKDKLISFFDFLSKFILSIADCTFACAPYTLFVSIKIANTKTAAASTIIFLDKVFID